MALAIHSRLGPYEIQACLGTGGMGEVYRAWDSRLERNVAIKVLPEQFAHDPQALARFHREARAVATLSHPNVVAIFDIGTEGTATYAVMELLQGHTLRRLLEQGPLDLGRALEIGAAIADGLSAAHAKGIVHRDVKPENIFLTEDGGLKVLDFGLARLGSKTASSTPELDTQPGALLGTVAYMSPEQVRGQPASPTSDLFALGCVLYELVTSRRPFLGETAADTMSAILHDPVPTLSQTGRRRPAELDRLILRCLEKDPARRPQAAREVAQALKVLGRTALNDQRDDREQLDTFAYGETPQPGAVPIPPSVAPSIAVLPFRNMSSDPENEYFSDGLAEELINALAKVEGLRVASRTSAFAFKGRNEDVRTIGSQLNVRTVLDGSVRKSGNRLRISAQLVNVADGYNLWSETYNRELQDVFAIQDEIAESITEALRLILSDKPRRAEKAPTADMRAYEFYLRGRQFFHQFRSKGLEFARQMFGRAIEIDAGYALAHAGLADCHSLLFMYWAPTAENLRQADEASRKALQLAPDLAEAHVARGLAVSLKKQYAEAEQELEKALRLDPSLYEACYFYGRTCKAQGKLAEAARLFEQAAQLRPDDYQALSLLTSTYAGMNRPADMQAACRRCLQKVEAHLALHPDDDRALYLGAIVWCQLGQPQRGLEWAAQALAMGPEEPMTLYNVACVYALQGRTDQALDCLEGALKHGFTHKEWVQNDSDLTSLRDHPRYQALVQSL